MEYLDQNLSETTPPADEIQATRSMRQQWYTISRWALFFAIVGFIMTGILLLAIGSLPSLLPLMEYAMGESPMTEAFRSMGVIFIGLIILAIAIQLLLNYWQLRFANQMKRAISFTDQEAFESSWLNLRNFFRAIGIMTLVGMFLFLGLLAMVYAMSR